MAFLDSRRTVRSSATSALAWTSPIRKTRGRSRRCPWNNADFAPAGIQATFEDLRRWIGKRAVVEDQVTATPASALAATLVRDAERIVYRRCESQGRALGNAGICDRAA